MLCYNVLHVKDTITIRVPQGLRRTLRAISREEKIPLSDLVRESIRALVARRQFRRLRAQVLPFAESQGLLTDEDIFRTLS